jgi:hypothetical protein
VVADLFMSWTALNNAGSINPEKTSSVTSVRESFGELCVLYL